MLDNQAFLLDQDGNVQVETDEFGNQSFEMVEGVLAMAQSIRIRLTTPVGELSMHPEIGFPIKQVLGILNAPFAESSAKRSALLDPDVGSVPHAEAVIQPGDGRIRVCSLFLQVLSVDGVGVAVEAVV